MESLRSTLRSGKFWAGFLLVFGVQLLILFLTTPLYEIDTNSYIRGGLTWSIYHNPFLNIYIAGASRIWSNICFLIIGQVLFFAFSVALFARTFLEKEWVYWIGLGVASIEPVTLFYNFSLISESFFSSFILLTATFFLLYLREGDRKLIALSGIALGFAFMTRLAALPFILLAFIFLLELKKNWSQRWTNLGVFVLPVFLSILFVHVGQVLINDAGLFTVKGRTTWDLASSQYNPDEVDAPYFKSIWHPHLFPEGRWVEERDLRKELGYLGYKDCLSVQESNGASGNEAIMICDSILGDVGGQILKKHFWKAEGQFILDNFSDAFNLNYLDYRFTEGLPFYHDPAEYEYLDSLMATHYMINLAERADDLPRLWRDFSFINRYMPVWFVIWWIVGGVLIWLWMKDREKLTYLLMAALNFIPLLFHLFAFPYRLRFLAPYLVIMMLCFIRLLFIEARRSSD